jgi:hypothetical protein
MSVGRRHLNIQERSQLFGGRGRQFDLCLDYFRGESEEGLLSEAGLDHFLPRFLDGSSPHMPDLDFFRQANNANRFFLRAHMRTIINTHDRFFEYVQERLIPNDIECLNFGDLREEIASLKTEFGSEKDLLGIIPVFIIELRLEGHSPIIILPVLLSSPSSALHFCSRRDKE